MNVWETALADFLAADLACDGLDQSTPTETPSAGLSKAVLTAMGAILSALLVSREQRTHGATHDRRGKMRKEDDFFGEGNSPDQSLFTFRNILQACGGMGWVVRSL